MPEGRGNISGAARQWLADRMHRLRSSFKSGHGAAKSKLEGGENNATPFILVKDSFRFFELQLLDHNPQ